MNFLSDAPLEVLGDVGHGQRGGAGLVLAGVARELDVAAHLAVDLHAERDALVDGQRVVVGRPGGLEQEALARRGAPSLVAEVRREGADQLDQRQEIFARGAAWCRAR